MADVTYIDSASVSHTLETEPGDGGGAQVRPVHGLPDDVKATLAAIQAACEALTGAPSGGSFMGQVGSIGTAADVTFSSQALVHGMTIKNISASGELLYLSQAATPTSTNSYVLYPGETTPFIECTNANAIKMRSSTGSAGMACYSGA